MQQVHYFQRYSQPENVATNNTLLLFSRLYYHLPAKYNLLLNDLFTDCDLQSGTVFKQQEKSKNSVPDGSISQKSFQIIIETKLYDNFSVTQLINHCKAFSDSQTNILLSLSPGKIKTNDINKHIEEFNINNPKNIIYVHLTFKEIISTFRAIIDDSDTEFNGIIDDFEDYCFSSGLIDESENWMRAVTCGMTLEENFKYNLYYDPASRGFSKHGYIGIYANKCIRGIGKVVNIIIADYIDDKLEIIDSTGEEITENKRARIINAINEAYEKRGWKIDRNHKFFMVDNFFETNYQKTTKSSLRRTQFFNLCELLDISILPNTEIIAEKMKKLEW